jgi:hypothetical protein
LACPRRCDVARHLLLTVVTSPLRATTLRPRQGVYQSRAPSASTNSSESALGAASPRTPRSHISPPQNPHPAHRQQRRTIAPGASPRAPPRSPPLRTHHPHSPQPARLPHSSSRPLRSARSHRGQSFQGLSHTQTAPTAPPPRGPAWPATRGTHPNHAPASPLPGTPRRTGPTHPQRRSPGCRSPQRLRRPPAARDARRRPVCPARPPRARGTGSGASQRAPTPRASSPACRLVPAIPWSLVTGCCHRGQAPAQQPCTAQPTPRFPPVRSSGRRPTRTKALESSGRGGPRCARRYLEGCGPTRRGIGKRAPSRQYPTDSHASIRLYLVVS